MNRSKFLASAAAALLVIGTTGCASKPATESTTASTSTPAPVVASEPVYSSTPIISSTSSPEVVASRSSDSEMMSSEPAARADRN